MESNSLPFKENERLELQLNIKQEKNENHVQARQIILFVTRLTSIC